MEATWKVYYDGLCPLCSREIDHYRLQKGQERLEFIDITDPAFSAEKEAVDPVQVHKVMHVKDPKGQLKTGVEAFIEIWSVLPKYNWAARLSKKAAVKALMNVGYFAFAQIRPYLPRKTRSCEASPYCELKEHS